MKQSDFLLKNLAYLEIVFLEYAIQHSVNSKGSPKFRRLLYLHAILSDPGKVGNLKILQYCLRHIYTSSALSHFNYLSGLYRLRVQFHPTACRLSANTSLISLPNQRLTRYKALFQGYLDKD